MSFYIMCSYPQANCIGTFETLDQARDFWYDHDLSGQTDEESFYWTESDCPKHGRVGLSSQSECEMCDLESSGKEEQANIDADAQFDASAVIDTEQRI